jgi:protein-S-isoprenylcysteine O-methyltransferase Ste14
LTTGTSWQHVASVLLFLQAGLYAYHTADFTRVVSEPVEALFFAHNAAFAVAFLVRRHSKATDRDPIHWFVCGFAFFSGLLFKPSTGFETGFSSVSLGVEVGATFVGLLSYLSLGRSFGVMPAMRQVQTRWAYRVVRHPMYLASILFKAGYVLKHPTAINVALLAIVFGAYHLRCRYEEELLQKWPEYGQYMARVRYRMLPGLY